MSLAESCINRYRPLLKGRRRQDFQLIFIHSLSAEKPFKFPYHLTYGWYGQGHQCGQDINTDRDSDKNKDTETDTETDMKPETQSDTETDV
jgi:hypothetical protein